MKENYTTMSLKNLDALSTEDKAKAKEAINAKLRVIGSLRQRTNYQKKQLNIDKLTDETFDRLLVIEYGLGGFDEAKKTLDELNKD